MSLLEQAVIIGLAAWRLTALISYERGPLDVFLHLRALLGFEHNDNGEPVSWPNNILAQAIACAWCTGVYVSVGVWGLWQISESAVMVLAAMAVLVAVERFNHR